MGLMTNTLMLLFFISLGMWVMGYQSTGSIILGNWYGGGGIQTISGATLLITVILAAIGGAALVSTMGGALTSNYGVIYTIPIFMVGFLVTVMILPLSFINEPAIPAVVKILLTGFFTICILASALGFIRGYEP
jgi:hypothetical protein